ncbi:CPBP family intramembrane glutamic endopeptidase [Nocardia vaccinii]|uniref:CPBP family intramembrane glutamic endopeptidase n=1 Tax=Nocardia vaccinii TaxID=1822 RepID=UPI001FE03AF3|nr:type II CAAX endopeptidase family protein [Nocardia vaccinii]
MALPMLWNSWLLPRLRLGVRGRTVANAAFATVYAAGFGVRGCHGPRRLPDRRSGSRAHVAGELFWGSLLFCGVTAGYAVALRIPPTRSALSELGARGPEVGIFEWVGVHIPIGTVYSEELIFRCSLDALLDETAGSGGIWLGAASFGLWHIGPARASGDGVLATVAATAVGGLALGWLRRRTGGVVAPALLHLALNAVGAIASRSARRSVPRFGPQWTGTGAGRSGTAGDNLS